MVIAVFVDISMLKVHALMQISKSTNIFVFIWKYVEDFTVKHLLLFEICEREGIRTIVLEGNCPPVRVRVGLGAIFLESHIIYVKSFYQPVVKWKGKSISWAVVVVKKKFKAKNVFIVLTSIRFKNCLSGWSIIM